MTRFTVQGKEYELKIDFESVEYLNSLHAGGAMMLINKVITGDVSTFIHIAHAALFHTGQNFAFETIRSEVKMLFDNQKLDLDGMLKINNELVLKNFLYAKTVKKLMAQDHQTKQALEMLLK